jgi:hypothetical protein
MHNFTQPDFVHYILARYNDGLLYLNYTYNYYI